MSAKDNGGAAFPVEGLEYDHYWYNGEGGMSLRDYFAAKVISHFAAKIGEVNNDGEVYLPEHAAKWSYSVADAMLKARTE